ncbi:alpha/beta hydrolase [Enterobacteriaceae bacterium H11S18]|uniref:alpha/beta fold hydrolase n=1 Tax=Dryocola clanedunensis TaxID=2925396 RepID=UPI0022F07AD2|nr:alpha/beta hydrolase [Dryocola clanedunensis]MCT4713142.1 alpha/beta hydrolase [Dryocola clanedunensis]
MDGNMIQDNHDIPLVLLGGTLCNHRLWQPVIERLNVSQVTNIAVSGADSAQELSPRLLETLPPRFCVAGFSLGAMVALQMLAEAPERLAGLALLSVNPLADLPANAVGRRAAVSEAKALGAGRWVSEKMWQKYVAPEHLDDAGLHSVITTMADESGIEAFSRQTEIAISRADHRAALAAFSRPTLILNGAHDAICTPQHHQLAAEAAITARWLTHADSGHFLPLEAPDWVATALCTWIKESKT